jgi:RNA polymerase sigma-70 factor (ECF subfamily)
MQRENKIKEMIEKYSDMVYRIALTRCGCIENAEDIFQDVFIKLSEKMPNFESEEHEKAWLIRVTINLTKNMNNSSWNKKVITLDENITFETKEESDVFSSVCELPQNYRTVIYLLYYEGYKIKEIAKLMKTKEGTVKTWAFRAREILKQKLEGGF